MASPNTKRIQSKVQPINPAHARALDAEQRRHAIGRAARWERNQSASEATAPKHIQPALRIVRAKSAA